MILLADLGEDDLAKYELYWTPIEGDEDLYGLTYLGVHMVDNVQKVMIERMIEEGASRDEIICFLYECTDYLINEEREFRGGHPVGWVIIQLGGLLKRSGVAINLGERLIIKGYGNLRAREY